MTEEEMKAKLKEQEDLLKAKDATISSLESQRSNQNAYITKLEQKAQTLESNMNSVKAAANNSKDFPPEVVEYFQKKRREDYTEQAYTQIQQTVSPEIFNLMKPEVDMFLDSYMNEQNVSVKYIIDAFHLLLGKAYADPTHPINNKTKAPIVEPVKQEPVVDSTAINQQVARMQNVGMTNSDQPMATPAPVEAPKAANTKEALESFKTRLLNGFDSTKFE